MKIALKHKKDSGWQCDRSTIVRWLKAAPFSLSTHGGVLLHRVRFVSTYLWDGRFSHCVTTHWCGSITHNGAFFHDPPKDRLLCATCEEKATANEMPSAETLVGRHVCIGRLRPERLCCTHETN